LVIEVRLNASLRHYRPLGSDSGLVAVDVHDSITLGELLEEMEINVDEIKIMTVNGADTGCEKILFDGDRVELFPADFDAKV